MADSLIASETMTTTAPTPAEWRTAMGYFPTGVTIVTSWRDGAPVGSTVNAFCSVSLDPPLLLVCLDVSNPICRPLVDTGLFGVNILAEDGGGELARRFAISPEAGRFEQLGFRAKDGGAPQLVAAPVFVDCAVESVTRAGDHFVVVGRGVRIDRTPGVKPLLYHAGHFHGFEPQR